MFCLFISENCRKCFVIICFYLFSSFYQNNKMARTKHTIAGDPSNPPPTLLCGHCGFGPRPRIKRMLHTMKSCCVCNKPYPVHSACAKTFFKYQNKKKETYDEKKFLKATLKFYCNHCKTPVCVSCEKEHPLGTP